MKVRIEVNDTEDEVIIRCTSITENIKKLEKLIREENSDFREMVFYKNDKECFLNINSLLFFEVYDNGVYAHTNNEVYRVKFKLYELENILPRFFIRVSKSSIININYVYSIEKGFASSSLVEFYKSHKQVYVSRMYYKILKEKLRERRLYEK